MKKRTLSMFAFYGGKALLAPFICDLLDYDNTSIYVEPFGGGARVLLNKPRHDKEIYNDGSASLCAFMRVMSKRDTAIELIQRLYDSTVFSKEQFELARDLCKKVDRSDVEKVFHQEYVCYYKKIVKLIGTFDPVRELDLAVKKIDEINTDEAYTIWNQFIRLSELKLGVAEYQVERPLWEGKPASDVDIAVAVFVMYTQSRDGMGTNFSSVKFKTQSAYYKRIDRLYQVLDRLEGVLITNAQAELFFTEYAELFTRPEVMAYCDPPYLSDIEIEGSAVKKDKEKAASKDLGGVYRYTMDPEAHERFLKLAQQAQCKMVISNYSNKLYDEYLRTWTRIEVPVTTSVGGKKGNKRVEVLWYNY